MYGKTMYTPTEFITEAKELPCITPKNVWCVIEELNASIRCKILVRGSILHLLSGGKFKRLSIVTDDWLGKIQKAWPIILINGEYYRFVKDKDTDFLGLEKITLNTINST